MFAGELRKQKALFAVGDALAVLGAFSVALYLHDPSDSIAHRLLDSGAAVDGATVALMVIVWVSVFRANDLYRIRNGGVRELLAIAKACSIATLLTLLVVFVVHFPFSRITLTIGFAVSIPATVCGRAIVRFAIRRLYANPKIAIPLVMIGFNSVSRYLCDQLLDEITPYEPVGFLDSGAKGRQYRGLPVLDSVNCLAELRAINQSLEVAIALPEAPREELERIIENCEAARIEWWIVPWMLRSLASGLRIEQLGVIPLIGRRGSNIEGMNFAIKRAFDLCVGLLLLLAIAPVAALAALAIYLDDGGPILFRQTRVGAHARPFEMLKLRTMRASVSDTAHREYVRNWISECAGNHGQTSPNGQKVFKLVADQRITRVGRYLRRFSVDELPQIINVLRGQMSLIGPRPALPYELELYQGRHRRRLDGKPGITGLWQVSGRNRLSFEEMVQLDVQYLEDWSFLGDLKILARTVPVMLRGAGL
jgi:exopolysaccharide biosynthesis polyprenyl glycosylphosphotransferase